ncbi:hypothetical protein OG500_00990 [Kitasatospora sp. NBC_01250]|uniref:hypothetical protein n=1 Tax=unclassified Kitasatospora TaxID=2633591 RepID=UPI002E0E3ECF|nr:MULTISPECIES: hypothetical protein [unclassified Kitasatospora]WSJ64767.1 hypothetical protein OG294_00910 [Kitasatospora sp. NBC_01302]
MTRAPHPRRQPALWAVAAACAVGATPALAATPSNSHYSVVSVTAPPTSPGGTTTVNVLVVNNGPDTSASPHSVRITLPGGATTPGATFPSTCTTSAQGTVVTCTFPPGLRALRTATVLLPVRIATTAAPHSQLTGGWVHLSSADDAISPLRDVEFDIVTP